MVESVAVFLSCQIWQWEHHVWELHLNWSCTSKAGMGSFQWVICWDWEVCSLHLATAMNVHLESAINYNLAILFWTLWWVGAQGASIGNPLLLHLCGSIHFYENIRLVWIGQPRFPGGRIKKCKDRVFQTSFLMAISWKGCGLSVFMASCV